MRRSNLQLITASYGGNRAKDKMFKEFITWDIPELINKSEPGNTAHPKRGKEKFVHRYIVMNL